MTAPANHIVQSQRVDLADTAMDGGSYALQASVHAPYCIGSVRDARRREFVAGLAVVALSLLFCLLMVFGLPASAQEPLFTVEPTGHEQLDRALVDRLNLPALHAAGAMGEPGSDQWIAAVEIERKRLGEMVRSFGYLAGRMEVVQGAGAAQGAPEPASVVRMLPVPGPVFRIGAIQVSGLGGAESDRLVAEIRQRAGQDVGLIAAEPLVSSLTGGIVRTVRGGSFPHARLAGWELLPDPDTGTATLRLAIDTGPMLRLGPVIVRGANASGPEMVKALAPFSPGDPYDPAVIEAYRAALVATPQVRRARVEIDEQIDTGLAPVIVSVVEEPDPLRLDYLKVPGLVALGLTLAVLASRQIVIAAVPQRQPRMVQGFDIAVLVLLILGTALVLKRIMMLAFPI